jgi:NADPH:quinone reductase-like Zn-dependent oxidoreductase
MTTDQVHGSQAPSQGTAGAEPMTSIVQDRYGAEPEDVLRLGVVSRTTVGDDEVLVRVHAASVDRGTWHIMAGLPYPIRLAGFGLRRPRYANPGRALAGTVEAVGAAVTGFARGDEVFGTCNGSLAEYAVVRAGKLSAKPTVVSFEQAAAAPISGVTALQAVRDHGRVQRGHRVLVIGASGGVGSFAVQIAKAAGAVVTGVAGTGKVDAVRALGADSVLDYTESDVTDGGHRYDVVLDTGGNRRLAHLRRALAPTGRLVIVGGETDGRWLGGSDRQLRAALLSPLLRGQHLGTFVASENAADLAALADLMTAGAVTAAVDRTYPLAETAAAIRHLIDGRATGKVVVRIAPPDVREQPTRRPT